MQSLTPRKKIGETGEIKTPTGQTGETRTVTGETRTRTGVARTKTGVAKSTGVTSNLARFHTGKMKKMAVIGSKMKLEARTPKVQDQSIQVLTQNSSSHS